MPTKSYAQSVAYVESDAEGLERREELHLNLPCERVVKALVDGGEHPAVLLAEVVDLHRLPAQGGEAYSTVRQQQQQQEQQEAAAAVSAAPSPRRHHQNNRRARGRQQPERALTTPCSSRARTA